MQFIIMSALIFYVFPKKTMKSAILYVLGVFVACLKSGVSFATGALIGATDIVVDFLMGAGAFAGDLVDTLGDAAEGLGRDFLESVQPMRRRAVEFCRRRLHC